MPVVLSPQVMYATAIVLDATAVVGSSTIQINTSTGMLVLRIREPATGPVTGYLIRGDTPTLVLSLAVYLDAPDMDILLNHDLHSKPLAITFRGPLRFLPDGRIAIAVANVEDVPISVNVSGLGAMGSVDLVVPTGAMSLQLVSPALRGGVR
jgi:hypothetical protein